MYKNQYKDNTYVKEILSNGFTSKHLLHEMKLLAKHYKEIGYDEDKRKELLYGFCENNIKNFNKVIYFKTINKALNHVINSEQNLVEIESVNVSKNELDYIDNLDIDSNLKKLVFTLLTLNKLNKKYLKLRDGELKSNEYYFGGYKNYKDLASHSKVTFDRKNGIKNIHDLIGVLSEKGIIEIVGKGNIKLLFMYEIEDDSSEGILVEHFDVIGYYYDRYIGDKKIKECEECGVLIKANSNRVKYCNVCSKEKEVGKVRERVRKHRNTDM